MPAWLVTLILLWAATAVAGLMMIYLTFGPYLVPMPD